VSSKYAGNRAIASRADVVFMALVSCRTLLRKSYATYWTYTHGGGIISCGGREFPVCVSEGRHTTEPPTSCNGAG